MGMGAQVCLESVLSIYMPHALQLFDEGVQSNLKYLFYQKSHGQDEGEDSTKQCVLFS